MAEAHQAVVFALNVTNHGVEFEFDRTALEHVLHSGVRYYKSTVARLKTRLHNGFYPARPGSLAAVALALIVATMFGNDLSFGCVRKLNPLLVRLTGVVPPHDTYLSCFVLATAAWALAVLLYKTAIWCVLSYHGWLYEVRGPRTLRTRLWFVLAKLLIGGRRMGLNSFAASLPRLPVPPVADTVARYLESMRPLLSDAELAEMRRLSEEFLRGPASRLQLYLRIKSWWSTNYVSDWWERYVYLYSREPIMVNSNYYGMESIAPQPTKLQVSRAANVSWTMLQFWRKIRREEMPPITAGGVVPLCSWQYERQFATTRVPGEERDRLVRHRSTRHIAVLHRGRYFKVHFHHNNRWLKSCELERQLQQIVDDKSEPADGEQRLAALTAGNRQPWAAARQRFFSKGVNRSSLEAVERAAFVLALDDEEADYDPKDVSRLNAFAKSLLHGNGCNRWFDKSFTLVVFANGRFGFNAEHSWGDAVIMSHLMEEVVVEDPDGYNSNGRCKGTSSATLPAPQRLRWELPAACVSVIDSQLQVATNLLNDVDLHLLEHRQFGKGAIKRCSMSPDAFIQLALQLAYFRDSGGSFCLTYEASMTRLFQEGRTETVRSCTSESCDFVRRMESGEASKPELVRLLRAASSKHQRLYRDAMTGKGVDRHLFTLYVMSKYRKVNSEFLERALHCQWKLSTSQTPLNLTNKVDLERNPECITAGGGFGPVSESGYGVSYIICGEDVIFFHISSRVSSELTDSRRFAGVVCNAMADLKNLFEP